MKKILLATLFVASLGVISCNCTKKTAKNNTVNVTELNGAWNIIELNGKNITVSENSPYMELDFKNKRLHGKGTCNRTNGNFELSETNSAAIRFPAVMTTRMACPEMQIEAEYLKALNDVQSVIRIDKNKYAFLDSHGCKLFIVSPR
ncbi:MAG: META domain-containing protein [Bacteroidales bacterium]